jgi:mono/diheme cytochrome c family protein
MVEMTMSRLFRVMLGAGVVIVLGGGLSSHVSHAQAGPGAQAVSGVGSQRAFVDQYCVGCHSDSQSRRGAVPMSLQGLDMADVGSHAELWEKAVRKVRGGMMPPPGSRGPDSATRAAWLTWLETELDRASTAHPRAGRPMTAHRLNRGEYKNAVRDLIGLDVDIEALLPPDDADAEGFDNNSDVLSVSATLMERYLAAARRISQLAIGDPAIVSRVHTYQVAHSDVQDNRTNDDLPFGTRGGLAVQHHFPVDGEYLIKIGLRRNFYNYIRGLGNTPHQLDVRLDKTLVKTFMVGGDFKGARCATSWCGSGFGGFPEWGTYSVEADKALEFRLPVKAGTRLVGVAFVRKPALDEGVLQPPPSPATFGFSTDDQQDGNPGVAKMDITGPFNNQGAIETPSRRKIFVCRPKSAADESGCAEKILGELARRAYRRPVAPRDVTALMSFYGAGRREGSFDAGIQAALEFMLTDPEFVFRVEHRPAAQVEPGVAYRVSDLELASRLSFFLWGSIPDDELLDAAAKGQLKEPAALERQVRRMLAHPRARNTLGESFAGQWLGLRKLRNASPDPTVFPEFDETLRVAMQRETQLFLETQLRDDRPVMELVTANYTFVNDRLAQHYGIPNVHGNHFRRVTWPDDRRTGILGQASILTLTSYANRTSPVTRGKWVLENILGTPPAPPPADVPPLKDREEGAPPTSLRARMELHRTNPACATCHRTMDPLGFALENFDGTGRWRTTEDTGIPGEAGPVIDSSGVAPDGSKFDGATGLRQILVSRQDEFVGTVIERLLTYAVGRRLEALDMPAVRRIQREAAAHESRWSAVIMGIVNSGPFQTRRIGS